jgi:hypothetical protein
MARELPSAAFAIRVRARSQSQEPQRQHTPHRRAEGNSGWRVAGRCQRRRPIRTPSSVNGRERELGFATEGVTRPSVTPTFLGRFYVHTRGNR